MNAKRRMEALNITSNGTELIANSALYTDSTQLLDSTQPITQLINDNKESTWLNDSTTTNQTNSFLTFTSTKISSKTARLLDAITSSVLNSTTNFTHTAERLTTSALTSNLINTQTSSTSPTEFSSTSTPSTPSVSNVFLSSLRTTVSSTKPSRFDTFVVVNNKNSSLFSSNGSNSFISIDNQAKEILLVSTAFAAMILCTCLLVFMLWFCCFALFREKKFKANAQMLVKSIKETEMNLRKLGIVIEARKHSSEDKAMIANGEDLLVRDNDELNKLKSMLKNKAQTNDSNFKTLSIRRGTSDGRAGESSKKSATKLSEHYEMSNRIHLANEETKNEVKNDSFSFTQPYDMLDSNRSTAQIKRKKMKKEAQKKEISETKPNDINAQKANEQINEAFVNDELAKPVNRDYDRVKDEQRMASAIRRNDRIEYVSHLPMFSYLKPNKESNEMALLKGEPRVRSTANLNIQLTRKHPDEPRVGKSKAYCNQTGSLNRRETSNCNSNSARYQSSSLTRSKAQQTASKLSREQIEKEFYEYTLECRKRIKELFSDSSLSSSEHEYTSFNDEQAAQLQRESKPQRNRRLSSSSSLQKATSKRSTSSPYGLVGVEQVWRV